MDSGHWTCELVDDNGTTATGYRLIKPNGDLHYSVTLAHGPVDRNTVKHEADNDVRERNGKSKQPPPTTPPQVQGKRS